MADKHFLEEFGGRVRQLRILNGWTQREMAEHCGYTSANSHSTINKIEKGRSDISISKLMEISELFGVSASYLLGLDLGAEEASKIAQKNAMQIMNRKLTGKEREDLMKGLEYYFQSKSEVKNA